MSKPLATKVRTPLSGNVQIGPKVSIFCVATIIFQHCLNPLGHGVHQSFTGCHWSHWRMLETLRSSTFRLRMPHRCSIGFRSGDMLGQSITFTLSFFSKAVVILEVCLGSLSCWNTALRPSLRREGIMLCFSMSQYMLAFMVPSMNCSSSVPAALMQPQTMTLPPPCLTVGKTHLPLYSSPSCRHTRLTPSEVYIGLIRPQDMVPVIHVLSLLVFSKLFAGFLVHHLCKRLPSGTTVMQTNLMQCAAYGLSTDRLTPHPFNLCSNAGSTHTSISQPQHSTSLVDHGKACSEWKLSC